jgi:hypothetical protein
VARTPERREAALERRHIEAAEQIVAALGTMKGAAMKVGQMTSFLDVGLVPEEYREEFQKKLGALRDAAPTVSFRDMRRVIEQELEDPLHRIFEDFDETPVAAASIGQVYRATLADGRRVAVKVQYPGVAAAVRADMQNLGLILRLAKRIAPGLDPNAVGSEIRQRIDEELDYELEAQNQRTQDLPRASVHRRPRRRHASEPRARARHRVRRGNRIRPPGGRVLRRRRACPTCPRRPAPPATPRARPPARPMNFGPRGGLTNDDTSPPCPAPAPR